MPVIVNPYRHLTGADTAIGNYLGDEPAGWAIDCTLDQALVRGHSTNYVGALSGLLTVSRASSATYFDINGVLRTASSNVLRLDYDPATHAALGALIEEQRTNLSLRSEEFGNAYYTLAAATISADVLTAPDASTTADKLVEAATTAAHIVYRNSHALTAIPYTYSVFLKAAERTWAYVRLATIVGQGAWFDLGNGVVGTVESGVTAAIKNVGGGFYRCSVTITATASTWFPSIQTSTGDNASSFLGDSAKGIYLWGGGLEAGSFASSYTPTAGSQVTRAADAVTLATSAIPTASALTVACEGRTAAGAGTQVIFQMDDGTASERIRIVRDSSNNIRCIVTVGDVDQCNLNLGSVAGSTSFKVALRAAPNDFSASLNGAAVVTDGSGSMPTVTTLRIGSSSAGEYWNSTFAKGKVLPRGAYDTELRAFAA